MNKKSKLIEKSLKEKTLVINLELINHWCLLQTWENNGNTSIHIEGLSQR